MSAPTPVKVLYQDLYYDAKITRDWGDGCYEVEYENKSWGKDTVDQSRIQLLQEVDIWFDGDCYSAKIKTDHANGNYDIIYDNSEFGEETVPANRIRWTKGPLNFAGHENVQGAGAGGCESTQEDSGSTSTKNFNVIGQRVKVKDGEEYYLAVIKESHVDDMYLVEYDNDSFGEKIVDSSVIVWNLVGLQVDVLFDGKYYRATVQRELDENVFLIEYLDDYGVESVGLDRMRWVSHEIDENSRRQQLSSVLEKPNEMEQLYQQSVIGTSLNVWFEGKLYPATLKAVHADGKYLIQYDDREYGEEEVEKQRVVWPKQQPEQKNHNTHEHVTSNFQRPPQHRSDETYTKLVQTTEALINMTKKTQILEEQISRLSGLPRSHLESLSTETQHQVFNDLSQILKQKVTCTVCWERPKTKLLFPCQHRTCANCSQRARVCAICETPITKMVSLFEG